METYDAIMTRRSIRKYTDNKVSEEQVEKLLRAAMQAPSASDQRPWHFIVLNDQDVKNKVPTVHPYASMVPGSSVSILVCGDMKLDVHKGFWVQDCSAATENLLLAAQGMDLGAVWVGVHPREDRVNGLKKLLDLPEHVIPFALIPVGYPGEEKGTEDRYDEDRIRYNSW